MRDPGYISEAAWNEEEWFLRRDADGYDREQDQRWDMVAGSDFFPAEILFPTASHQRGVVPGPTARRADSPQDPAGLSFRPAGSSSS